MRYICRSIQVNITTHQQFLFLPQSSQAAHSGPVAMLLQAEDIMAVFFAYDSEEEDQAVAPTINTDQGHASTYAFGTAVAPPTGGFNFLGGEATTCPPTGGTDAVS